MIPTQDVIFFGSGPTTDTSTNQGFLMHSIASLKEHQKPCATAIYTAIDISIEPCNQCG